MFTTSGRKFLNENSHFLFTLNMFLHILLILTLYFTLNFHCHFIKHLGKFERERFNLIFWSIFYEAINFYRQGVDYVYFIYLTCFDLQVNFVSWAVLKSFILDGETLLMIWPGHS